MGLQLSYEQMQDLLTEFLGCGSADLSILSDSEYPMDILVEYARDDMGYEELNVNTLCYAMFQLALNDVQIAIDEKLDQMGEDLESEEITEAGKEKIMEVMNLNLDIRDDVESFHNFIDTHAYLNNNQEIYQEYFKAELDIFEAKTGYSLNS